ncbi:MAG TPA: CinA family protein [Dissulfurispiraceae bacterium]|nr:CinA family protein [Dissulfurispiraceae bacterium]
MTQETLDIIGRVHQILTKKGISISVAESCTGGMLSHLLTLLPGSSAFFAAGFVVYSEEAKNRILGVSSDTLIRCGMVSAETAIEMAERARVLAGTDYSIATTGNLGPDVLEGKERGLIYVAMSGKSGSIVQKFRLDGDRQANRKTACLRALELFIEELEAV